LGQIFTNFKRYLFYSFEKRKYLEREKERLPIPRERMIRREKIKCPPPSHV
jgi:hypothetical protein